MTGDLSVILARWISRMLFDVVRFSIARRSPALAVGLFGLFALALAMVAAQVASPFVYTLF
jgi:hypothetical protein